MAPSRTVGRLLTAIAGDVTAVGNEVTVIGGLTDNVERVTANSWWLPAGNWLVTASMGHGPKKKKRAVPSPNNHPLMKDGPAQAARPDGQADATTHSADNRGPGSGPVSEMPSAPAPVVISSTSSRSVPLKRRMMLLRSATSIPPSTRSKAMRDAGSASGCALLKRRKAWAEAAGETPLGGARGGRRRGTEDSRGRAGDQSCADAWRWKCWAF